MVGRGVASVIRAVGDGSAVAVAIIFCPAPAHADNWTSSIESIKKKPHLLLFIVFYYS